MLEQTLLPLLPPPLASLLTTLHLLSPLNLTLLALLSFAVYSLVPAYPYAPAPASLPGTPYGAYNWRPAVHPHAGGDKWARWTPQELRVHDGTADAGKGRVLIAVRRKVYDVSTGRSFYGPGGPYASFAGRDASRGLAKQSFDADMLTPVDQPIDSLGDLSEGEWGGLREWEEHFRNKYPIVGDLIPSH
ncbi:hypothetical protein JCM6882_000610 [Rhodosporidiobolus microsporus]